MFRTSGGARAPRPSAVPRRLAACAAVVAALAGIPGPGLGASGEAELQKARRAAQSLQDQLRERMDSRIREGGLAAALKVCAYQSQGVARDLEQTQGVTVRRTSLRARGSQGAPDEWEKAVLGKYDDAAGKGFGLAEVFERVEGSGGGKGTWRYARPIVLQKGCLACHGSPSEVPPEVAEVLRDKYPGDKAMGYRAGDFYGIVSVRFPE